MLSGSDNAGACRLLLGRIGLVLHVVAMLQHEQGTAQAAISTSPPCNISFCRVNACLDKLCARHSCHKRTLVYAKEVGVSARVQMTYSGEKEPGCCILRCPLAQSHASGRAIAADAAPRTS
eukprot:scaffold2631_cov412-Prasinococcus_capsulatus_cf.AAC.24